MRTFLAATASDTQAFGRRLGEHLFDGAVVLLHGDLGAGKTCFAQGVAAGLGVSDVVHSPTFILIAEYPDARIPLRHADLYRLETEDDVASLALDERVGREGVWLVEWPERAREWPEDRIDVALVEAGEGREISVVGHGEAHRALVEAWFASGAP